MIPLSNKSQNIVITIIVIIVSLTILLSFLFRPMLADDYCLTHLVSITKNNFLNYISVYRAGINGRIMPSVIYYFCFYSDSTIFIYRIITFIVFFILIYVITVLSNNNARKNSFQNYLLVFSLIWFFTPGISQSVFWDNSSAVYLWGSLFVLLTISFLNFVNSNKSKYIYILLIPLFYLTGTFMEQAIAVILFYCLSLIIKTNEFKFNILSIVKTSKKICTLTLVFFLGALTMVFSPANLSRASSVKNHSYEHIPTSILIFKIFQYSISIIWPILIIYIILFLIYTKSENKKHQKTNFKYLISENPYLIMSILSIAPFYLTGLKAAGERTLFLPFILGLIFILKLFNSIEVKRYLNFKSLVFLLIILLIDAIQASRSNYYYYKVGQQNLVELKKTGELKVYEKINALHRTTYLSDYNPLEPNSFWIKDCMNDYIKNK